MKKLIAVFLVLAMLLPLSGCIRLESVLEALTETDAPTSAPEATEAPSETEAPATEEPAATEIPTEAPTEEPAPTEAPTAEPVPSRGCFCDQLQFNVTYRYDLDFDGMPDTLYIERTVKDEWVEEFVLSITLGCAPSEPFTYTVSSMNGLDAYVMDCYPDDGRLEIMLSWDEMSYDWTTVAFRVIDGGTAIQGSQEYFGVWPELVREFSEEYGFIAVAVTDILGTHDVSAAWKIAGSGFVMTSDDYVYSLTGESEYDWIRLKKKLNVELIDEEGNVTGKKDLKKGDYIEPVSTDCATYVVVRLEDGRLARIEIEVRTWAEYGDNCGIFINGRDQDYYADLNYAG